MYIFNFTDRQKDLVRKMKEAFDALIVARDAFVLNLRNDNLPAWSPSGGSARKEAESLYGDFFFPHEQSAESDEPSYNVVSKGCGLIGASSGTIMKAEEYNIAKVLFD